MNELRIRIARYLRSKGKYGIMIHCRNRAAGTYWKYRTKKGNREYLTGKDLQEAWENLQATNGSLERTEKLFLQHSTEIFCDSCKKPVEMGEFLIWGNEYFICRRCMEERRTGK